MSSGNILSLELLLFGWARWDLHVLHYTGNLLTQQSTMDILFIAILHLMIKGVKTDFYLCGGRDRSKNSIMVAV